MVQILLFMFQTLYLSALGGKDLGDTVRRQLRKIATNNVLGQYSLKGKKKKKNFGSLAVCSVIISKYS